MKLNAWIAGVGMTAFARHPDVLLKELASLAVRAALDDAGLEPDDIQAAYMANAVGGIVVGQEMIAGQVALRHMGVGRIPVVNVENACASASTAFHQACAMVSSGAYDVVLACGFEKLHHPDKGRTFAALAGGVDVEDPRGLAEALEAVAESAGAAGEGSKPAGQRSLFMDLYALAAIHHMKRYGTTREQLAAVSAKNSFHGSLNPNAQYRDVLTVEEVLAAREIAYPLTLPMCSPIGDGAAAVVVMSAGMARQLGIRQPVRVRSCVLASGWDRGMEEPGLTHFCAQRAYEEAGIGPGELSVVELHDASAPSEIIATEQLGLCPEGKGGELAESGATRLGGALPVNTSGGLLRKGHPVGATGIAQIFELTRQLQGRADQRQVPEARVGLAHNGGGNIGVDAAATVVTLLAREELA
ncbi:MAG: thiolase family protein [Myxococcota bacterium]|nr:thiolase family protein [Myxococcota bacterium]